MNIVRKTYIGKKHVSDPFKEILTSGYIFIGIKILQ